MSKKWQTSNNNKEQIRESRKGRGKKKGNKEKEIDRADKRVKHSVILSAAQTTTADEQEKEQD